MFQLQSTLALGRRPFLFKSTQKKALLDGKTIDAHIAKCGMFKGYRDGEFQLTRKLFDQMIANFQGEKNPLPVYFGHSDTLPLAEEPEAKGWILALERRGDDLWAKLEMTGEMESKIREGKFRFTSIFCRTENVHRETGKSIGARLISLAITNSPFIDGLQALSLSNTGKVDTYQSKDIQNMIDHKNKAETILSALALDATEERLAALEAALQEMMPEEEMPEEAEAEEEAGAEEEEAAPEIDMERLEALRAMASELMGEELDMAGLLDKVEEMLTKMAEAGAEAADPEAEAMAAGANARKADGPDAVGVAASDHPAFIALKSELNETKKLVNELQEEKKARDEAEIEAHVLSAIEMGKILDTAKDHWIKAMKMDKELALSLMDGQEAVKTDRIVKVDGRDSKKQSSKVIALTQHERRILAGAGVNK